MLFGDGSFKEVMKSLGTPYQNAEFGDRHL